MFKKILTFALALFVISTFWITGKKPLFNSFASEHELYIGKGGSLSQSIIVSSLDYLFFSNVIGESCSINEFNFEVGEFFSRFSAKIIFTEQTDDGMSFYGYSPKIKYSEKINGHVINLHVCVRDSFIKVGSPIIYGSF